MLLVIAHAGSAVHREADTTLDALPHDFAWKSMLEEVREFVNDCLHCVLERMIQNSSSYFHDTKRLHA